MRLWLAPSALPLLQIIASLQVFGQIYLLTTGGPNFSTRPVLPYVYESGFSELRVGFASAMSFIFFLVVALISAVWFATLRRQQRGNKIKNFYHILNHLRTEFITQKPETKKDIMRRLIQEIKVRTISPHLYQLEIVWIKPIAGDEKRDDIALLWRSDPVKTEHTTWSTEEEDILREMYPVATQLDMMIAMPWKTPGQIKKRAWQLEIKRTVLAKRAKFYWTMTYKDLEVAQEDERDILWPIINDLAERTKRGQLSEAWLFAPDDVSFAHAVTEVIENESSPPTRTKKRSVPIPEKKWQCIDDKIVVSGG